MVAAVPITPTGPSPAPKAAVTPDSIIPWRGSMQDGAKASTARADAVLQATTIRSAPFFPRKSTISRLYCNTVSADLLP